MQAAGYRGPGLGEFWRKRKQGRRRTVQLLMAKCLVAGIIFGKRDILAICCGAPLHRARDDSVRWMRHGHKPKRNHKQRTNQTERVTHPETRH